MLLSELRDYKNQIMKDLLTNEKIVELINNDDITFDNARDLAYRQIFPYEYIPETLDKGKTFICFDVDVIKSFRNNKTFNNYIVRLWVFTHKSKMRLPQGGVRVDDLVAEINSVMSGSRYYGLGELDLYSIERFAVTQDYQGKVLTYEARDFNRPHGSNKQGVPSNRKSG